MSEDITLDEYRDAYREMRAEEEGRDFYIHLSIYLLVNAILIVVNLMFTPGLYWFFFPLIGWGIGITSHYLESVRWIESHLEEKEARAVMRARKKKRSNC